VCALLAADMLYYIEQKNDVERNPTVEIASFWDITDEFYCARAAAAAMRTPPAAAAAAAVEPVGPEAVWRVLTTHAWALVHRDSTPRNVATLVTQQAMNLLCHSDSEDEACMPYRSHATLWEGAVLTSLPASMGRNSAAQEAGRFAPEICLTLYDPAHSIGVAADWVVEGTVEGAWVSGQALATAVLSDVACNAGRRAALVGREQEDVLEASFRAVDLQWQEERAECHTNMALGVMRPVLLRWSWLPAAKALGRWCSCVHEAKGITDLLRRCISSHRTVLLSNVWDSWEGEVLLQRSKKVMKSIIDMMQRSALTLWFQHGREHRTIFRTFRKQRNTHALKRLIQSWVGFTRQDNVTNVYNFFVERRHHRQLTEIIDMWRKQENT